MSYKTMLVFLDVGEDSPTRLDAACKLASIHGAHLNALAMSQRLEPYVAAGIGAAMAEIDVRQMEEARKQVESIARDANSRMIANSQLGDVRRISQELFGLQEAAAIHGRLSDLVIAGQPTGDQTRHLREVVFEGALFSSGRPVFLMPSNWQDIGAMDHILVAWDASREAARALSDAAPFIDRAKSITVAVVDPAPGRQGFGDDPGSDIATVLARHCSNVELARIPSSGSSIAEALLTRTRDIAADLVVMGGYGHSRIRESLFGGVTREMIERTELPLLL